jgi:hypothetical protein
VLAALPGAALAAAAPAGATPCRLSPLQQAAPGRTPAYDLTVARRHTSCALAVGVTEAFHRCRTAARVGCPRLVLHRWRCRGARLATADHALLASFSCSYRGRLVAGTYRQATRPCFGAAARDPRAPCVDDAPTVSPPLGAQDPESNWQCTPDPAVDACVSGVAEASARAHVALVGDSHSEAWRAALNFVAGLHGWRVYSHLDSGCFFATVAYRFTP